MQNLEIDIRRYEGQKRASFKVGNLQREGRVDQVEPELWIVGNDPECFNDVEFIKKVSEMMADALFPYAPDYLLAPATRALMTAYKTAELLGHSQIAIARKTISPAPPEVLRVSTTSITSGRKGKLMIDGETRDIMKGKKVALFDDIISRGDTMKGLKELARLSEANVVAVSTVGIEGAAPYSVFEPEFRQNELVYLAVLPLFATGQTYKSLVEEKRQVEEIFRK